MRARILRLRKRRNAVVDRDMGCAEMVTGVQTWSLAIGLLGGYEHGPEQWFLDTILLWSVAEC